MTRKNGIDLFRLIGAFFIITVHTTYGNLNPDYVDQIRLLARWAVPFFFMATGYFLGNKIDNGTLPFQRIQHNVSMLITIMIVSSIVYMPVNRQINYKTENLLVGTYHHLWFIGALLTGYLFIWYMYFIKKNRFLPYVSVLILGLAVFSDSYDQILGKNIEYNFYRFLLSIPFMYIGILISNSNARRFKKMPMIGLVIAGMAVQILEANYFKNAFGYSRFLHQFLIGTIIISIPLFILSTLIDIGESKWTIWGRKHALFIYLYHPIGLLLINAAIGKFLPNYAGIVLIFSPIIGFLLMLSVAIILDNFLPFIYQLLNGNLHTERTKPALTH
jgi:surface polysaccharide O-acyltransferase-like enzyme